MACAPNYLMDVHEALIKDEKVSTRISIKILERAPQVKIVIYKSETISGLTLLTVPIKLK